MSADAYFDLAEIVVESGKTSDVARAVIPLRSSLVPLITGGFSVAKLADALPAAAAQSKIQADAVCSLVQTGFALAADPTYGTSFRKALKGFAS